jgi:hypothetical protein
MIVGNGTTSLRRREEGNVRALDEGVELSAGVGPEHPAPGDDQRSLRGLQELDRITNGVGVRGRSCRARAPAPHDLVLGNLAVQHVAREIEMDRTGPVAERFPVRRRDVLGNAPRLVDLGGPLGERAHRAHLVDLLEIFQVARPEGARAREQEDGRGVEQRVHHAGRRVDGARPRRGIHQTNLPGRASVSVRHHRGALLVARVDRPHAEPHRLPHHVEHRPAGEIENHLRAFGAKRLRRERVSGNAGHDAASFHRASRPAERSRAVS